jgi:hypothetical protein
MGQSFDTEIYHSLAPCSNIEPIRSIPRAKHQTSHIYLALGPGALGNS